MNLYLPPILRCEMSDCFFNRDDMCHAPAIHIGSDHPNCDTYVHRPSHTERAETGLVGACHIDHCRYNTDDTCLANRIVVAHHIDHGDCETFQPAK